jgi:hypothetical protein
MWENAGGNICCKRKTLISFPIFKTLLTACATVVVGAALMALGLLMTSEFKMNFTNILRQSDYKNIHIPLAGLLKQT